MFHLYYVVLVLLFFLPLGWVLFFPLRCPRGDLLSVSIPDLIRSLESTKVGFPVLGYVCDLFYFFLSFFCCVLDLFPFNRLKATHFPGQYLFWGHSSELYHTRNPSLCWPLACSESSSIPTWFSRLCPIAFLRPELGPLGFPSPNC